MKYMYYVNFKAYSNKNKIPKTRRVLKTKIEILALYIKCIVFCYCFIVISPLCDTS